MSKKVLIPVLILGVFATSGCRLFKSEEQSFIDASIEATCLLSEIDFTDTETDFSAKINDIYARYGFPIEDQNAMTDIMSKYETMDTVRSEIDKGTKDCLSKLQENILAPTTTDETVIEVPEGTGEVSEVNEEMTN